MARRRFSIVLLLAVTVAACHGGSQNRQQFTIIDPKQPVAADKVPDGVKNVMSIDLANRDVRVLFTTLADLTGKQFRVCKKVTGTITYKNEHVSWETIVKETAELKGWHYWITDQMVGVC